MTCQWSGMRFVEKCFSFLFRKDLFRLLLLEYPADREQEKLKEPFSTLRKPVVETQRHWSWFLADWRMISGIDLVLHKISLLQLSF
ncbi:unnamed protein product [Caenorhabditis auriculariae]|uniref:Uncharacterized protein n=1 Tax=Caenorhabditis auriculariae TaxID=2777116 RepID=A0A8S1HBV2_9PELO|nr:unnamed protein product [Caenorhabditis auriculariae]